jgi:hypothetical protein
VHTRRGYVSRTVASDHNYLFNLNFSVEQLFTISISSFSSPIIAGSDTWNQDRQPPLNQDGNVTRSARASMALASPRGLLFFREAGPAEGLQPGGDG